MKKFLLTSLITVGFASVSEAEIDINFPDNSAIEKSKSDIGINNIINRNLPFTLAAHSSHRSHGSHRSHRSTSHSSHSSSYHSSHSSHYSHQSYGGSLPQENIQQEESKRFAGRNINSTPPESILPRSPAIVPILTSKEIIKGSSKEFVILTERVQLALYAMGYYSGAINGVIDTELKASIIKYQKKHNLDITGTLSDELIGGLYIETKFKEE